MIPWLLVNKVGAFEFGLTSAEVRKGVGATMLE